MTPNPNPNDMTEKERIEFIREHGTPEMKSGLKSIFNGNKYKPKRKEMWVNRLHRGKRMVKTISNPQFPNSESEHSEDSNSNSNSNSEDDEGFLSFV